MSVRPTGEKDQRVFNPFGPEKKLFIGQENYWARVRSIFEYCSWFFLRGKDKEEIFEIIYYTGGLFGIAESKVLERQACFHLGTGETWRAALCACSQLYKDNKPDLQAGWNAKAAVFGLPQPKAGDPNVTQHPQRMTAIVRCLCLSEGNTLLYCLRTKQEKNYFDALGLSVAVQLQNWVGTKFIYPCRWVWKDTRHIWEV